MGTAVAAAARLSAWIFARTASSARVDSCSASRGSAAGLCGAPSSPAPAQAGEQRARAAPRATLSVKDCVAVCGVPDGAVQQPCLHQFEQH